MSDRELMLEYYGMLRDDFGTFAVRSFRELFPKPR